MIIKLDAIGDVLRTSCITPKIKARYPESYIVWITRPEAAALVGANPDVDEVWPYDVESLSLLPVLAWDYVYSPSNDRLSAALATLAKARVEKIGFLLSETGSLVPTNHWAELWLKMAVADRLKQANILSYQEILYGICGFSPPIEPPRLRLPESLEEWATSLITSRAGTADLVIGLNTGAGSRWPRKMPQAAQLRAILTEILGAFPQGQVLLLGGPPEQVKNREITQAVNSPRLHDLGSNFALLEFAAILSRCSVLLCGDTLALHLAAAMNIPTVALFGPTSISEIHPYQGLIDKLSSGSLDCLCCYSDCHRTEDCMTTIPTSLIIASMQDKLGKTR